MIKVNIWEMDGFMGRKLDEVKTFDTLKEAQDFCAEYNSHNNLPYVPEWYMVAIIQD
jgi:hypothetical protein